MGSNPTFSIVLIDFMFFYVKISSKDLKTLKLFLLFLSKFQNSSLILKYFPKQKFKKVITVLKSPHANKSAQEQFEYRVYTKNLVISSLQNLKFLYFLKKVQNTIFSFIHIEIKWLYNKNSKYNNLLQKLNPNNLNVKFFTNDRIKSNKILSYVQLMDCYGELYIK